MHATTQRNAAAAAAAAQREAVEDSEKEKSLKQILLVRLYAHRKLLAALAVVGVVGLAVLAYLYLFYKAELMAAVNMGIEQVALFLEWVRGIGYFWGPLALLGPWIIASFTTGFTILTLASGFIYGASYGVAITILESTVGASLVFLVCRRFFRDWLKQKVEEISPAFGAVYDALEDNDKKLLFLIRLSPFLPFAPFNLMFSLSPISFPHFLLASGVGLIPRIVLTVLAGSSIGSMMDILRPREGQKPIANGGAHTAFILFGIFITLLVFVFLGLIVKKAMDDILKAKQAAKKKTLSV